MNFFDGFVFFSAMRSETRFSMRYSLLGLIQERKMFPCLFYRVRIQRSSRHL